MTLESSPVRFEKCREKRWESRATTAWDFGKVFHTFTLEINSLRITIQLS